MRNSAKLLIGLLLMGKTLMAQIELGVAKGVSIAVCSGLGTDIIQNISGWNLNIYAEKKYQVIAIQAKYVHADLGQTKWVYDSWDGVSNRTLNATYTPLISEGVQANLKIYLFNNYYYINSLHVLLFVKFVVRFYFVTCYILYHQFL